MQNPTLASRRPISILALAILLVVACEGLSQEPAAPAIPVPNARLVDDAARPAAAHWKRAELYFGVGKWKSSRSASDESRWHHFLDREVTPRFPQGLSVLDAYGQWLPNGSSRPERLHSKVLVILFEDNSENDRNLDEVRAAWKRLTGDVSVLRVITPVDISF